MVKDNKRNMCTIGIDPSINSTGICVVDDNMINYYILPAKLTKRMQTFEHDRIMIYPFDKQEVKGLDYESREIAHTNNIIYICNNIRSILSRHAPTMVCIEGVAYNANGTIVELAGLNYAIRMICNELHIPYKIVSPTSLKKFAVANGSADKNLMIYAWNTLEPELKDIKAFKVDDLADAYFLAQYGAQTDN